MKVAVTSGRTAKVPSVAKKSPKGTSLKKPITGRMSAAMMPRVIRTETKAETNRTVVMTFSPGRERPRRSMGEAPGRPAPRDEPAPVLLWLLMRCEVSDQPEMPWRALSVLP